MILGCLPEYQRPRREESPEHQRPRGEESQPTGHAIIQTTAITIPPPTTPAKPTTPTTTAANLSAKDGAMIVAVAITTECQQYTPALSDVVVLDILENVSMRSEQTNHKKMREKEKGKA
jgi:hypothetical protein